MYGKNLWFVTLKACVMLGNIGFYHSACAIWALNHGGGFNDQIHCIISCFIPFCFNWFQK
jgi:hypothetical protein